MGDAFIKAAAAAGVTRLGAELEELVALEAAHGRDALVAALARAVEFSRYKAADVRSILAAGQGGAEAIKRRATPWCSTCLWSRRARWPSTPPTKGQAS